MNEYQCQEPGCHFHIGIAGDLVTDLDFEQQEYYDQEVEEHYRMHAEDKAEGASLGEAAEVLVSMKSACFLDDVSTKNGLVKVVALVGVTCLISCVGLALPFPLARWLLCLGSLGLVYGSLAKELHRAQRIEAFVVDVIADPKAYDGLVSAAETRPLEGQND